MSHLSPLYLAEVNLGRLGKVFLETDRDSNSRSRIVELIRHREHDVIKVLEVDEEAGCVRNVTDEIVGEALSQMEAA